MARTFLDELRRVVLGQLVKIGVPVANIHGAAPRPVAMAVEPADSSWLALQLPGSAYPSIDAFYRAITPTAPPRRALLTTSNGIVSTASATNGLATFLFRGTLTLPQARNFALAVDGGAGSAAAFIVALDGRVVRQGVGGAEVLVHADSGNHLLEVLVTSRAAGVAVPKDLLVTSTAEVLTPPVWRNAFTGYADPAAGSTSNTLQWFVDPRVGGWIVYRRQESSLTAISVVGSMNDQRQFTVTLSGDQRPSMSAGASLFVGSELLGTVIDSVYTTSSSTTSVRLQLAATAVAPTQNWVGRAPSTVPFAEVTRITRTTAGGYVEWSDSSVSLGAYSEYALQAYGLFDPTVFSQLNESRQLRAGDVTPPAAITVASGYPTYIDTMVRVKFHTPTDTDYAGVRVYRRLQQSGTVASATSTTLSDASASAFTAGALNNYTVRITGGTGAGQQRTVSSNTAQVLTVSSAWMTTPDATSTYLVFFDKAMLTDFGLPDKDDSLSFEPYSTSRTSGLQLYHFRTFDQAGNEQGEFDCATYTLDPSVHTVSADAYDDLQITLVAASTTATQVALQVTASNATGTPQVKLLSLAAGATLISGPAIGTLAASGTTWVFGRPQPLTSPSQAMFESYLSGTIKKDAEFPIAEQGRDTVPLLCKAKVTGATANSITVSVTGSDPLNASAALTMTVDDVGTLAAGSVTPASVTGTGSLTQAYTIPRPAAGAGASRVVFKVTSAGRLDDYDSVDVPPQDVDTTNCTCQASITAVTTTQITVTVTAPLVGGQQPQVQLVGVTGSATLASGTAAGTYVTPNGTANVWVFTRGAFQAGMGQAQFRAHLAGTASFPVIDDDGFVQIADQGRDTVGLSVQASLTATSPTTATLSVLVTDPYPGATITLSETSFGTGGVSPSTAQTVVSGTPISYTVQRPAAGTGLGRVVFSASATGRINGLDSIDVPEQPQDTASCVCQPVVTSVSATQVTVTVNAPLVSGQQPQVELVGVTGSATLASGTAAGTLVTPNGTVNVWVFNRGAFQAGLGQAQFRAHLVGSTVFPVQDDDAFVQLPEQGRDTVSLGVSAVITATSTTSVTVSVTVTDPYPGATITLTETGFGTGAVNPSTAQTATSGTAIIYTIARPAFSGGTGRVVFTATAAGRVSGVDSIDVPEQQRDTVMPYMRETPSETATTGTLVLTPVDPQNRITLVECRTYSGRTLAQDWTAVAIAGGVYTQTVALVDKQPSRIDWRMTATQYGGGALLTDEGSVRYVIGGRPADPVINYTNNPNGTIDIYVKGDSDTNRIAVALTFDGPAQAADLDAAPAGASSSNGKSFLVIADRVANWTGAALLTTGQKFYITAAAYNTNLGGTIDTQRSTTVTQTDQWMGPSSGVATVSVAASGTVVTNNRMTLGAITFGASTAHVDVYCREYLADPGFPNVSKIGHKVPGTPIYASQGAGLVIPGTYGGSFLVVTLVAVDALNRVGFGEGTGTGTTSGQVTIKMQLSTATPTYPPPPASLALVAGSVGTDIVGTITMGSITSPSAVNNLRVSRSDYGVIQEFALTAAANGTQTFTDHNRTPGSSYTYTVYSVNTTTGLQSQTGASASFTVPNNTASVPAPSISCDTYGTLYDPNGSILVSITAASGTPNNVSWQIEHSTTSSTTGFTVLATQSSTSYQDTAHPKNTLTATSQPHWIRVAGTAPGYGGALLYSNVASCPLPAAGTKTAY